MGDFGLSKLWRRRKSKERQLAAECDLALLVAHYFQLPRRVNVIYSLHGSGDLDFQLDVDAQKLEILLRERKLGEAKTQILCGAHPDNVKTEFDLADNEITEIIQALYQQDPVFEVDWGCA